MPLMGAISQVGGGLRVESPVTETLFWRESSLHDEAVTGGVPVEFRLVYQGSLPAAKSGQVDGGRRVIKHAIRKEIHKQLAKIWNQRSALSFWIQERVGRRPETNEEFKFRIADKWIKKYRRFGFNFLPLVTEEAGLACSIDILFLRPDVPGKIVDSTGDIDNRIKVLFDGLRIPRHADEVEGYSPAAEENPFFCLLEDDSLINEIKVTTDRLLTASANNDEVLLILHIRTLVVEPGRTREFLEFYL